MPTDLLPMILILRHHWSGLTSLLPIRAAGLEDAELLRLALTRRIATHECN